MDHLRKDVTHAARGLWRQPGFTLVTVLTLALGIGATSAMFSVVRAVLLAPLPYSQPASLVMIWSTWVGTEKTWLSDADVLDYRERARSVAGVAAWQTIHVSLTGSGDAVRAGAGQVTANLFNVLGVRPIIGQTFRVGDDQVGHPPVAVLSYALWQRDFGGDPAIVGSMIDVNSLRTLVLGVTPPAFQLPTDYGEDAVEPTELWLPLVLDPTNRGNHALYGAARLAQGATRSQVDDDLARIGRALTAEGQYPAGEHFSAFAVAFNDQVFATVQPALWLLTGAVGFLLLVTCANVAALLLARAEGRQRELALRTALGATRWGLVRQQLVEGGLLALTGGGLGIGLSFMAGRLLQQFGHTAIPRATDATIDWRVLLFTVAASATTALLFTLPPALRGARIDVVDSLKDGSAQATTGRSRLRLRGALVISQLAFALLLLTGAGLMLRSLWQLQAIDLGFAPGGVLTARVALPRATYDSNAKIWAYYDRLLARVRAIPGVTIAGLVRSLPLGSSIGDWTLQVDGYTPPTGEYAKGDWQLATDGGIEALGERLLRGRAFTAADTDTAQPVALVNETMAQKYWPHQDPIGGRFKMDGPTGPPITVVGLVANVKHNGLTGAVNEKFYRPYRQYQYATDAAAPTIVLRTTGKPMALATPLRDVIRDLDHNVPVAAIRPMTDVVTAAMVTPRLTSRVLLAFAGVALLLAGIGIYGLLSYFVAERTQELGVRMAIGAQRGQLVSLVIGRGLRLIAIGGAAGLVLAALGSHALRGLLYSITPLDPLTFAIVSLSLGAVALTACFVPAWRASRIDPLRALKRD
jgi:putative ABC transport system permease protein